MTPYLKTQNLTWLLFLTLLTSTISLAQKDVEKWKLQLALGVNNPIDRGEDAGYYSKYINFPTVNLGVQHMLSDNLGAKLDVGYNRASSETGSLPYKMNYTRINLQAVYDFKDLLTFLPPRIGVVAHAGPGVSMTKPLGSFANNTYTYLNFLGGAEVHYRISKSVSVFADAGYAYGLSGTDKYDVTTDGFSFNGDLMYVAFGVSLSLSGCNYCF
ncbi:outer membrane beta-barrel protein [Gelidibacter maritimus]|uniref:Outer membrane beta-barrel protein n=1 Tax=Gelidibacter maritimus TaxID=2761487 RepID=A0A7W2M5M3_9FLAO|nr:outer membrane beta-barrel protein [Gelidibacter maritimus]MBA6153155.1 outer membrane beta-barrel protein [Gelidibacter maritimus]